MGGVGKSVMAAAFARATETRRVFTDGVIWLTIGENPDPSSNMLLVGLAFGDDPVNYVDLDFYCTANLNRFAWYFSICSEIKPELSVMNPWAISC